MDSRLPRLRWLGHATVLIEDRGTTVLTDPVLTSRVAHLRRRRGGVPAGVGVHDPDVVLLSHLHADHTHLPSLRMLDEQSPIVVPRGAPDAVRALRRLGNELIEVSPGDEVRIGSLTIHAVPADHDGRRWRHGERSVPALGYLIAGDAVTYFAGDTDVYDDLHDWVHDVDLALLTVGGWGPTLGHGHMDPERAAVAAGVVGARCSVPIHFGTLWPIGFGRVRPTMFDDPGAEFVRQARSHGLMAVELQPGEELL